MSNVDPMIGRLIGEKYRVIDYIGGGGFGAVYRAEQEPVGRLVALKVIKKSNQDEEELRARFLREARSAARLKSPHIVTLFDYGEEPDGTLYMVFEFVEGRTLKAILIEEKTLPIDRAAQYAVHILEGLSVAHVAGIIHRDLKPANIMLAKGAWGYEEAKVLDFGVAKMLEVDANDPLQASTRRGLVLGTPHYMSPEQARTVGVDARADLYAIGTLLYVMISGKPPFTGETTFAILQAHVQKPPEDPINELDAPDAFKAILLRALQKKPEGRYQTAREMAAALAPFARTPLSESGSDSYSDSDSQALASLTPDSAFALQSRDSQISLPSEEIQQPRRRAPLLIAFSVILVGSIVGWLLMNQGAQSPVPLSQDAGIDRTMDAAATTPPAPTIDATLIGKTLLVDAGTVRPPADASIDQSVDARPTPPRPGVRSSRAKATPSKRPTRKRRVGNKRRTPSTPKAKPQKKASPQEATMEEF